MDHPMSDTTSLSSGMDSIGVGSGWTINRGRFESDGQYAPGRATVTLNNVSGRYTPRNTASALYPNVTKGRRIALYCVFAGRRYYRFVGKIREISQESRPGGMTTHLECTDILADLAKERAFLNTQYSEMTSSIVNELLGNRDTDLVFRTLLDTDGATGIWELNNTDVEFSWDFTEVFVQNYDVYNGLTPFNLLHELFNSNPPWNEVWFITGPLFFNNDMDIRITRDSSGTGAIIEWSKSGSVNPPSETLVPIVTLNIYEANQGF